MEPAFEVVAVPVTERYDPEDDRWREQVSAFLTDLRDEVGGVERRRTPVAGTKGGIEAMVLSLASAGTFTAAFEFFRGWLQRDKSRSLDITFSDNLGEHTISLKGDALNDSSLEVVARAAFERIGGLGWQTPAIEPS